MRESPAATIDRLLQSGDALGALAAADGMLARLPNSFLARLGRCRAHLELRDLAAADADLRIALELSPKDAQANLLQATLDQRFGRTAAAIARLEALARGRDPQSVEAALGLTDLYFNAGMHAEMTAFAKAGGAWLADRRAALVVARIRMDEDFDAGLGLFRGILRSREHPLYRRRAGFEAANRLDKAGRYREAFEWAAETHRATTQPVEIGAWLGPLGERLDALARAGDLRPPRAPRVDDVAIVCAMPRSGTTLLETMLDRHPAISGIGEYDGLTDVQHAIGRTPGWPRKLRAVPEAQLAAAQRRYLAGARHMRRAGAAWTFDKSLLAWQVLVEIAATLPGALLIDVARDPRDLAVSQFLSYLSPEAYAWTRSLELIREMIGFRNRFVPAAVSAFGGEDGPLRFESFVYEDLVEDPARDAARCLARMGLPMVDEVLAPEQSTRGAATLSSQQVRRPINRSSIGRWRNYEWAFDRSWDPLVAAHESRRR